MKDLINAARCALADLVGLQEDGTLEGNIPAKKTIIELYHALNDAGEDVSDYIETVDLVKEIVIARIIEVAGNEQEECES